jgi:DNA-binding transcriptional MerR regulator
MASQNGDSDTPSTGRYRIGAVSELTGIPPETLRAWERRYATVEPSRTDSGFRLYSEEDVERLLLIKRLSDRGNAIGSIAGLTRDELRERLARNIQVRRQSTLDALPHADPVDPCPLIVMDPGVVEQIRQSDDPGSRLRVMAQASGVDEVLSMLDGQGPAVVVAPLPALGDNPVVSTRRILDEPGALGVVVHFQFAQKRILRQLALAGAHLLKGPVELQVLRRGVLAAPFSAGAWAGAPFHAAGHPVPLDDEPNPEPRFTVEQLGRLREIESEVECECPTHMASMVENLLEFEQYSRSCEDLNEEDARVHRRLYRETGAARVILERALDFLCRAEGIEP